MKEHTRMETRRYTLRFLTPAFLGGADQSGQWRTPPIKHLLREWWRVAWAAQNDPAQWPRMREVEGRLLGHAWLENDRNEKGELVRARKSEVILRVRPWAAGKMMKIPKTRPAGQGRAAASALYLGYGPVKSATELKMKHPIDAGESGDLAVAFPPETSGADLIETAFALAHAYGTLGGRSRNGWGSVSLSDRENKLSLVQARRFQRDWEDCLQECWAHAIGKDEKGPLIWRTTSTHGDWKSVIEDLAAIRKQVNNSVKGRQRLILNQPVAGRGGRMPSQLRFKVREQANGQLYGVVYHMPHIAPPIENFTSQQIKSVWRQVHNLLDQQKNLIRAEV